MTSPRAGGGTLSLAGTLENFSRVILTAGPGVRESTAPNATMRKDPFQWCDVTLLLNVSISTQREAARSLGADRSGLFSLLFETPAETIPMSNVDFSRERSLCTVSRSLALEKRRRERMSVDSFCPRSSSDVLRLTSRGRCR